MIGESSGGIPGLRNWNFIGESERRSVGRIMGRGKFDGNNFFGGYSYSLFIFFNFLITQIIEFRFQTYFNFATQV
jgi:hypothetical protein